MLEQARRKGIISVELKDLRHFTHDAHGTTDDYQFGGGHGMVLKPEPVFEAVEDVLKEYTPDQRAVIPIVLLTPQGEVFNQRVAKELSNTAAMVLICGHYAGVDERVRLGVATREISIGDFVLTGGELAAMVVVDAVARLVPGVIGSVANVEGDSITSGLLQHPLYTRPAEFRGMEAPAILRSGNHGEIDRWRRRESLRRTLKRRPHLLQEAELNAEDHEFLRSLGYFGRNA